MQPAAISNETLLNEMTEAVILSPQPLEEERARFEITLQNALDKSLLGRWWGVVRRVFSALTRQKAPFVATVLFFNFCALFLCALILWLSGESAILQPLNLIPPVAWSAFTALYVLVMHSQLSRAFQILGTTSAESITSTQDLARLGHVIRRVTRFSWQFAFAFLFALVCGVWLPYAVWLETGTYFVTGILVLYFINYFQMAMYIYFVFAIILTLLALSRFDFAIYANDPCSSPIIRRISNATNTLALCVAALSALHYFLVSVLGFDISSPETWITLIVLAWLPPLGLFMATNFSLSGIMGGAKGRKLAQLQHTIEQKEGENEATLLQNLDEIQRLMNYHDRIKATPNSLVNFSSLSSLFGSLFLPLVGTILGNLDTIIAFFR